MIETLVSEQSNPLDLDEVKQHLNVFHNDDDEVIIRMMDGAIKVAEAYTGIKIRQAQYTLTLDDFEDVIELTVFPVVSIASVAYVDASGNNQTVASYNFKNKDVHPFIRPNYSESWPATETGYDKVTITVNVGFATLPALIKEALMMTLGNMYDNRSDIIAGKTVNQVPMSSKYLLDPYVVRVR